MTNKERIIQINKQLKISPEDAFLRYALATEYIAIGNDLDAKIIFESLVKSNPQYFATYYHLGKLYEREDKEDLALETYKKGMEITQELNEKHVYGELRGVYEELTF